MKLKELQDAMIAAMKAKDKFRKDAISALVSAVKKKGIDNGCRDNIPDEMANEAILKEIKSVKEQIDTCPADRTELLRIRNRIIDAVMFIEGCLILLPDSAPADICLVCNDQRR